MAALIRRAAAESRHMLALAGPIVASQLALVLMGLVDSVMAGRAGPVEQAVVGLGVAIWIPSFLALMGVVQAVSPLVAHHHGAGDQQAIVRDTLQGVWLGLILGVLPWFMLPWAGDLLRVCDVPQDLAAKTQLFLQGIALGLPAALMFRALAFYSAAINRPQPAMVLGFVSLGINGVLNLGLIYGRFGLPAMGGAGCGWATGIGMWLGLVLMVVWTMVSTHYRAVRLWTHWQAPQWAVLAKLLRLGLPIGVANLAEVAAFTGVALLIGALGPAVIAGHQTALNFASLIFMLPAGLSAALSIRVAQALGSGDKVAARFVAWCGMALALCLAVVITPALIWLRGDIAAMYSPDADVQAVAARLLLFAAAWHWADALQVCAAGALRGYRVTLAPMLVMIAAYWALALPLGALLARHGWPTRAVGAMGVDGYWAGLLVGLVVVAAALTAWLYRVANRGLESAR